MSKLDELIQELCPDGVEYKTLGELGSFYGGLSGKSREDFIDGNEKFITYKNVYANPALKIDVADRVNITDNDKKNTLQYGDVVFTGSSETPDECGMSSVVNVRTDEKLYLNSFCFFFRFDDKSIMLPDFSKHLFRSNELRYEIGKTASGVTRYNVSKKLMEKVLIPVPPLEVQSEIVRILDNFTEFTAELTAELTARKQQYKYYREILLKNEENVNHKSIGEICNIIVGGETPDDCIKGNFPDEIHKYPVWGNGKDIYGYSTSYKVENDAVCISSIGANTGAVFFHYGKFTPIIRLKVLIPKTQEIDTRFLFHALSTIDFAPKKSSVPNMSSADIKKIMISVPPLNEQIRIANILDDFDKICEDFSEGIPAEIYSREKQYEYYRDKLLTFKE